MSYFKPDFLFEHFTDITLTWLKNHSITHIFSDLDSTLAGHNQLGDEQFEKWLNELNNSNIQLIILSNNSQGRVDRFIKSYNMKGYGMANKPGTGKVKKIMAEVGATADKSLFLGDQIFTDIWCGKRLGMKTVLVHPVEPEREPWNITLKRKMESIVRRQW
ncbi:HAD-IIIA family hydrolase [Evansella sp. AB-P1]|uniref:YqeG family HAD IIIA-type phosphatase n=1 Tax=Evansella sp. AB-P1 TaxID=3037653 RepID=UPI00241C82EF|nr:HAD-IIIA family hydrolase [Evansella sp. AB-P1]MDG5789062.1 HAD-IIIA family hydrolase [Evansella sp. AB-P1]